MAGCQFLCGEDFYSFPEDFGQNPYSNYALPGARGRFEVLVRAANLEKVSADVAAAKSDRLTFETEAFLLPLAREGHVMLETEENEGSLRVHVELPLFSPKLPETNMTKVAHFRHLLYEEAKLACILFPDWSARSAPADECVSAFLSFTIECAKHAKSLLFRDVLFRIEQPLSERLALPIGLNLPKMSSLFDSLDEVERHIFKVLDQRKLVLQFLIALRGVFGPPLFIDPGVHHAQFLCIEESSGLAALVSMDINVIESQAQVKVSNAIHEHDSLSQTYSLADASQAAGSIFDEVQRSLTTFRDAAQQGW